MLRPEYAAEQRASNHLTTLNAATSPLFLLPAELREQIWTYAFGQRTIHVRKSQSSSSDDEEPFISFFPCLEPFSDAELHLPNLSSAPPATKSRFFSATARAHQNRTFPGSHRDCNVSRTPLVRLIPTICRQISSEATPLAWQSNIFTISDGPTLGAFLNLPASQLKLVTRLGVHVTQSREYYAWIAALSHLTPLKLPALRGLDFVHMWFADGPRYSATDDVLAMLTLAGGLVPAVVKTFRAFELCESSVTVSCYKNTQNHLRVVGVPEFEEQVWKALVGKGVDDEYGGKGSKRRRKDSNEK
jgi:hypothetical protein